MDTSLVILLIFCIAYGGWMGWAASRSVCTTKTILRNVDKEQKANKA